MATAYKTWVSTAVVFLLGLIIALPQARAGHHGTASKVKLVPVVNNTDLITDINVVGDSIFACTQPGVLIRSTGHGGWTAFLDISDKVGTLGDRIPGLGGLGYPTPGTYDERGLLGFAAHPNFQRNGVFWVWYTAINETHNAPDFFFWLHDGITADGHATPWDQSTYDHVGHLVEYAPGINGKPAPQRTLLKIKRPYFNHTGYQSLVWSPEHHTLLLALGDGGSEYDPNNIAQDDDQLSGKLLKIDVSAHLDFTNSSPVATFTDLENQGVSVTRLSELKKNGHSRAAFTALLKGLRNPSKVHFDSGNIKYLANTGQDTIEFIHAFDSYGLNFGFRPWEGIFPTSFEIDVEPVPYPGPPASPAGAVPTNNGRVLAYGFEASQLYGSVYFPFVHYTHLDQNLNPNANTGSALYTGKGIPGAAGDVVFTDWIVKVPDPDNGGRLHGLIMHATPNRGNLQQNAAVKNFALDLSQAGLTGNDVLFFTSINTDPSGQRLFVGGYKNFKFITTQATTNPHVFAGAVYEVTGE